MPRLGWTNQVPTARATANFTFAASDDLNDTSLGFSGNGFYHQEWSDRPYQEVVKSWFSGHTHMVNGKKNLSVVWFQGKDNEDRTYTSVYIAFNGIAVLSSCTNITLIALGDETQIGQASNTTLTIHAKELCQEPLTLWFFRDSTIAEVKPYYKQWVATASMLWKESMFQGPVVLESGNVTNFPKQ